MSQDQDPTLAASRSPAAIALFANCADIPVFAPARRDRLVRWLVIGLVFALYLFNAGSFGLWDPWETHYGEVTRNMFETYDWVNPWWGYARKIGQEPISGEWFYSKPIYIFWAELTFLKLIGYTDWALRIPQALLGASLGSMVYLTVERIASRNQALICTAVVALSPFVYMVSRQAQTDMPFVATMGIGLLFFALAFFGRRDIQSDRGFVGVTAGFVGFMLANLVPQFAIIATDLVDPNAAAGLDGAAAWIATIQQNGAYHLLVYLPVMLALLASVLIPIWRQRARGWDDAFKDAQVRRFLLLSGYMMLAQATYAKGLLGFMLPGAVLVLYMAVTRQWRLFGRLELLRGTPLFFLTVSPWYVAMFCRHGMPYYQRFFIHDHFNRVGAGVHQIDTGTFEYFVKWLGYGMFPWAVFVPVALISAVRFTRSEPQSPGQPPRDLGTEQLRLLALLWFVLSFALFTGSSTRFHHYILPGVPALGMVVGLYLNDLKRDSSLAARVSVVLGLGMLAVLVTNLLGDYQNLRNLFTYKYDRPLPENMPFDWNAAVQWPSDTNPILTWAQQPFARHVGPAVGEILTWKWFSYKTFWIVAGSLTGLGLLAMVGQRLRTFGLWIVGGAALLVAFWTLNYYMPSLAPHWSQKYLFEAYYEDCSMHANPPQIEEAYTPLVRRVGLGAIADFFDARPKRVCNEDIVSWLITWRGETYYSNNEIRPLQKATQLTPYLKEMNKGKKFYVLLERGRTSGFASKLKAESKKLRDDAEPGFGAIKDWNTDIISNDSAYFVLVKAVPVQDGDTSARPLSPAIGLQAPKGLHGLALPPAKRSAAPAEPPQSSDDPSAR